MILGNTFSTAKSANIYNNKAPNTNGTIVTDTILDGDCDRDSTLQGVARQIKEFIICENACSDVDSDKTRQKYFEKIYAKLKSGRPLTPKQLAYLQKYEPLLYLYAKIIEMKRKSVESQLRTCKSKEEAQRIQEFATSSIGKNNPIREMLISAVNYTIEEFKKTDSYKNLPATDKEANQLKKYNINKLKNVEDKENDKQNDKDIENDELDGDTDNEDGLIVQYDVCLGKYQEAYVCKTYENKSIFSSIQC